MAIAWIDTRPTWDDTGITAAALLCASGLAAVLGLRPWLAALLVAGPLVIAEWSGAPATWILPLLVAFAGGYAGAFLRYAKSRQ